MQHGRAAVLSLAVAVLSAGAALRGAEYDEGYTMLLTAGHRLPVWPEGAFTAAEGRAQLSGAWSFGQIARDLRAGDVHPPLYFWLAALWRDVAGPSLTALRLLSAALGVAGIALVGRIAGERAAPAMLMTLGAYGFAYTSMIARGFALAQALTLAGVTLLLGGRRDFAAGLLLGAAGFANYLASFAGGAAAVWALSRGRWRAAAGFALALPADLYFFAAQRGGRPDQFPAFEIVPSLSRLARYMAADLFGGLPLYAGAAGPAVGAAVACLCLALAARVIRRWRSEQTLSALCFAAPPAGLIALGIVFGSAPIELRYLAFSAPFAALLLAGARLGRSWTGAVLAVQAASIAGMLLRPETMQPQARAAAEAAAFGGLAIVPYGNDGVGVPAAFVTEADGSARLVVVSAGRDAIRSAARGERRVVLVRLGLDAESRAAVAAMDAVFDDPCWRPAGRGALTAAFDAACPP